VAIKQKGETLLSLDPDKADKTGFLHGVRAVIKSFKTILYNYPDKDGVGKTNDDGSPVSAPGFMVEFQVGKGDAAQTYNQFYGNGSSSQRVPNKSGTGFVLAPGSTAKSALVEGSNAFMLLASFKSCGWPTDQLSGPCDVFEGTVVDLIAQPIEVRQNKARAEGAKTRTIAVVGKIVSMPHGADEAEEDEEEAPVMMREKKKAPKPPVEEEEEAEEKSGAGDDEDDDEEGPDADLAEAASEYVAAVLLKKQYKGKPVTLDILSREVLGLAREDKNRKKIIALVQDPGFHKSAESWEYNPKTKSIMLSEE